jgi:hypothetical protein
MEETNSSQIKDYDNYFGSFDHLIESIKPLGPELRMRITDAGTNYHIYSKEIPIVMLNDPIRSACLQYTDEKKVWTAKELNEITPYKF